MSVKRILSVLDNTVTVLTPLAPTNVDVLRATTYTQSLIPASVSYLYSVHVELALRIALIHYTICGYTPCVIDFS